MMKSNTTRFSDRVENYVKYRPGYPTEVLDCLKSRCGLTQESLIADIGSGTGISTRLFLENQNPVYGVEPNAEMRAAGETLLKSFPRFHSVNGTAEETGLPADTFDFVVASQAFHWFDQTRARQEFQRILKPGGWVVLIWNERKTDSTPFLKAYEKLLLDYATDYQEVNHTRITADDFQKFFAPSPVEQLTFSNEQIFDLPALTGRLLSSSYCPNVGDPGYEEIMARLERIFTENQSAGTVCFEYDTNVYLGMLKS
ncbi:putative methyltransferase YcgJ [Gimesia panareensis]|uniref:Putative methyltransferase YcgJ n=1 Tax=Gimesia panareensis TaxID=2527978 RepID=A0A518FY81_9PLAN|nr:class I SAM-dependent methyltransferase [Gimesia panareensis]QDV21322.1 putative methyltransferase YcgJ [Gimesia panareensis]